MRCHSQEIVIPVQTGIYFTHYLVFTPALTDAFSNALANEVKLRNKRVFPSSSYRMGTRGKNLSTSSRPSPIEEKGNKKEKMNCYSRENGNPF